MPSGSPVSVAENHVEGPRFRRFARRTGNDRFFPTSRILLAARNVCMDGPARKCYTVVPPRQNKHRTADLFQIASKIEIAQVTRDQKVAVLACHRAIDIVIYRTAASNDLVEIRRVIKQWKRERSTANCLGLLATTAVAPSPSVLNLFPHFWELILQFPVAVVVIGLPHFGTEKRIDEN